MQDDQVFKPKRMGYLAGLIDGDGSFSIRFNQKAGYQLTTSVYSTCRSLMKWLSNQFGGTFRKMPTKGNRKQKYQWYTSSMLLAREVAPYLIIKSRQGEIVKQFVDLGSDRNPFARQDLMQDLQNANQFFVPVKKLFLLPSLIPTKSDFAYLAGLFDAEGTFSIYKRKYHHNGRYTSVARISNTDQRPFPWLMDRFGGYMLVNKKEGKLEGVWYLPSNQSKEQYILAILPYLIVKRERAILYLEWIRNSRTMPLEQKDQLQQKMKILNHRGLSQEANMQDAVDTAMIESELHGDMQREFAVMQNS